MSDVRTPSSVTLAAGRSGLGASTIGPIPAQPTVVNTFIIAAYVTSAVAASPEEGTHVWGMATGIAGIVVALLGPIIGAIADRGGPGKPLHPWPNDRDYLGHRLSVVRCPGTTVFDPGAHACRVGTVCLSY